ncbi:MAG: hypothetical protein ACHQT7_00585 [Candidatus Levyibacteriota bacterium]
MLFFGYGANRDKKRLQEIFKASDLEGDELVVRGGKGARIDNMVLAIQTFNQLPEEIKETMNKVWGDKFRSYTMKAGKGQIAGVIWELTDRQYKALRDWEFDGVWREMREVEVITHDQQKLKVLTDKIRDTSAIKEIVDGLNYEANLNREGMRDVGYEKEDEYRIYELKRVREALRGMVMA